MSRARSHKKIRRQQAAPDSEASKVALSRPLGRAPGIAWAIALTLVAGLYLVIKSFSFYPFAGDEFIYLYQSKLVSEGVAPYSGFAAAHPPFQMVFTALVFKIFGVDFTLMRLLPMLWCLAGGLALAWMVRRELGGLASVAAAALFLLSHEPLRASSHFTGVNMTTALLVFSVLAYRYRAIRVSALIAACAVLTRLYAIPGVAALILFAFASSPSDGRRLAVWTGGAVLAAFFVTGVACGFSPMVDNLFAYHAQKTAMSEGSLKAMVDKVLFHNATSAFALLLSLPVLAAVLTSAHGRSPAKQPIVRRLGYSVEETRTGVVVLCLVVALSYVGLLLSMDRIWMYYFIPAIAFAAVPSAWMLSVILRGAFKLALSRGRLADAGLSRLSVLGGAAVVVSFIISYVLSPRLESRLDYWEEHMNKPKEARGKIYDFQSSMLPSWLEGLAKRALWKDERVVGEPYNTFNYVLWHESRVLDIVDEVVDTIRKETSEKGEIFGDSGTVPLFALLLGKRIAANEVDTNIQRYRSGHADPKTLVSRIDKSNTEMIILRHRFGVAGVNEVQRLVRDKYERSKSVRSNEGDVYHLFKRKAGAKESPY